MKLRRISDIQPTLGFTEYDFIEKYRASFAVSELGRIHAHLPLKELARELQSRLPRKGPQGNTPLFPPDGEVALMFLKPYLGVSDDVLVEQLNRSIHMQMFCGVLIDPSKPGQGRQNRQRDPQPPGLGDGHQGAAADPV